MEYIFYLDAVNAPEMRLSVEDKLVFRLLRAIN